MLQANKFFIIFLLFLWYSNRRIEISKFTAVNKNTILKIVSLKTVILFYRITFVKRKEICKIYTLIKEINK